MNRLNWGCGPVMPVGWVNSDRDDYGQEHVGDIVSGLPWDDAYFDYVVSNHALQMIKWDQLVVVLTELRRVTRPGGAIRLLVPDLLGAFHAWGAGNSDWFPVSDRIEESIAGKLCVYITQAGSTRSVFTASHLADLLLRAGYRDVRREGFGQTLSGHEGIVDLDSRDGESLIMEGTA